MWWNKNSMSLSLHQFMCNYSSLPEANLIFSMAHNGLVHPQALIQLLFILGRKDDSRSHPLNQIHFPDMVLLSMRSRRRRERYT